MSTKIYNGFSMSTDSAVHLMDMVNSFRPYIRAEGQKMLNRFIRKTATPDHPYQGWRVWMDFRSETVDKGIRAPSVDTDFELTFFPDGKRFLGIAFTEHDRWFRRWLKQPLVSEYRYWDNSDKPSRISRKEWDQRAETWDRVLGYDAPSTRGFTISLHEIGGPLPQHKRRKRKS
ncbi:MAG: hypothetical protein PHX24_12260 [Acidithiobacillus sp.]|nr:hypothetical protein [Acidithiobacillus sp.]